MKELGSAQRRVNVLLEEASQRRQTQDESGKMGSGYWGVF